MFTGVPLYYSGFVTSSVSNVNAKLHAKQTSQLYDLFGHSMTKDLYKSTARIIEISINAFKNNVPYADTGKPFNPIFVLC